MRFTAFELTDWRVRSEREGGRRDVEGAQVQRTAVYERRIRTRPHSWNDRRGHADTGRQRHAAAGNTLVTLYWTVPQLRTELGEGVVSHQRSSGSTKCFKSRV